MLGILYIFERANSLACSILECPFSRAPCSPDSWWKRQCNNEPPPCLSACPQPPGEEEAAAAVWHIILSPRNLQPGQAPPPGSLGPLSAKPGTEWHFQSPDLCFSIDWEDVWRRYSARWSTLCELHTLAITHTVLVRLAQNENRALCCHRAYFLINRARNALYPVRVLLCRSWQKSHDKLN